MSLLGIAFQRPLGTTFQTYRDLARTVNPEQRVFYLLGAQRINLITFFEVNPERSVRAIRSKRLCARPEIPNRDRPSRGFQNSCKDPTEVLLWCFSLGLLPEEEPLRFTLRWPVCLLLKVACE